MSMSDSIVVVRFDEDGEIEAAARIRELREALAMSVDRMSRARGRLETIAGCNEDRRIAASLGTQCDFIRTTLAKGSSDATSK